MDKKTLDQDRLTEEEKKKSPMTQAILQKKRQWYSKVPLSLGQVNVILWVACAALGIVVVLIVLEALGIFSLFA